MTAPLTLVRGKEALLVDRAVSSVVAQVRKEHGQVQRLRLAGDDAEAAGALAQALAPSLFGEPTVIVVEKADELDEATLTLLKAFTADPLPDTHVVLVHPAGQKGRGVITWATKAGAEVADCSEVKGAQVVPFLVREARQHRRTLTPAAAAVLHESIGADLRLLAGAVAQLCSDVEDDPIDVDDAERYFRGVAETKSWDVADAVWERRPVDALLTLRWAVSNGATGPGITSALGRGLRGVAMIRSYPRGTTADVVSRETGVPPFKIDKVRGVARLWRPEHLAAATVHLAALDVAVKGGLRAGEALDAEQKEYALEDFVVRLATRPPASDA